MIWLFATKKRRLLCFWEKRRSVCKLPSLLLKIILPSVSSVKIFIGGGFRIFTALFLPGFFFCLSQFLF